MPLEYDVLYNVFPFHMVYNRQMLITSIGSGLNVILPNCIGQAIDEMFILSRPLVEFTIENVSHKFKNYKDLKASYVSLLYTLLISNIRHKVFKTYISFRNMLEIKMYQ